MKAASNLVLIFISSVLTSLSYASSITWPDKTGVSYNVLEDRELSPSDGKEKDWFGYSSHFMGSTLVVSHMNVRPERYAGGMYIFNDTDLDGNFAEESFQKLAAFDTTTSGFFGNDFAHTGDTLFIASYAAKVGSTNYVGAVYQIVDSDGDGDFAEETMTKITNQSSFAAHQKFGSSIAAEDNLLIVGATGAGTIVSNAAYVFNDSDLDGDFSDATQYVLALPDEATNSQFGHSVAISDGLIAIGAPGARERGLVYLIKDTDNDGSYSDEVYQVVSPPGDVIVGNFGTSLQLKDNMLVIGHNKANIDSNGSLYVVVDTDRDQNFEEEIVQHLGPFASKPTGRHVELHENILFVNSYQRVVIIEDKDNDGNFEEETREELYKSSYRHADFGYHFSVSDNQLIVTTRFADIKGEQSGAAYLYEKVNLLETSVVENEISEISVAAEVDSAFDITYSIVETNDSHLFTINPETGILTFSSAPDFEKPSDENQDGVYEIVVKAQTNDSYAYAKFSLTVNDVNDAPALITPISALETPEDTQFTYSIPVDTFVDDDGDSISYSLQVADNQNIPLWLTFNTTDLTLTGTPANQDVGQIELLLIAKDSHGLESSTMFKISVLNTNDSPEAFPDNSNTDNATSIIINALANDIDEDNDDLTIISASADQGTVTIQNNGTSLFYTPAQNFVGNTSITYTISDGNGGESQSEVVISVTQASASPSSQDSSSAGGGGSFDPEALLALMLILFLYSKSGKLMRKEM